MKKRILVVDDEPDFTNMLRLSLESHGYFEVREENDAERARAAAREFDPDVVLLDIMMPEMEGSEVAAALKADPVTRDVPVIFLTALVSQADAPGGSCSSGGHTFLPKDIRVEKLIRCIEDRIHQREAALAAH
jgi:putative two-component system response regulator